MRAKLQAMYPQRVIGPVATTQMPGIFEVLTGDKISYVDASGKYWLFNGQLVDLPAQVNITEQRLGEVNRIDPRTLPLGDAIKLVKGKGERTLFVFADPNCGFCKKLETDLKDMDNVTVYTFLYPILRNSKEPATHVWCASDRAKTWDDLMVRGVQPAPGACDTPLERNLALGQRLNVTGTPTMFSVDGRRLAGAVGTAGINAFLN
ncbi:MAG: DsbC family protein [Burkholderiaceae bacterium]|nr:DsbC family protein [Burkholderiaceae bacterium]MDP3135900.1 DsbC family protein [Burkholderiaceae bacterium]